MIDVNIYPHIDPGDIPVVMYRARVSSLPTLPLATAHFALEQETLNRSYSDLYSTWRKYFVFVGSALEFLKHRF